MRRQQCRRETKFMEWLPRLSAPSEALWLDVESLVVVEGGGPDVFMHGPQSVAHPFRVKLARLRWHVHDCPVRTLDVPAHLVRRTPQTPSQRIQVQLIWSNVGSDIHEHVHQNEHVHRCDRVKHHRNSVRLVPPIAVEDSPRRVIPRHRVLQLDARVEPKDVPLERAPCPNDLNEPISRDDVATDPDHIQAERLIENENPRSRGVHRSRLPGGTLTNARCDRSRTDDCGLTAMPRGMSSSQVGQSYISVIPHGTLAGNFPAQRREELWHKKFKRLTVAEEDTANAELVARLDRIADVMALMVVRGRKQDEQIRLLDAVGYAPAQIAAFLGIKRANTVSAALSRARKKSTSRKKVTGRKKATAKTRSTRKKPISR
jgi:hypothetical protein